MSTINSMETMGNASNSKMNITCELKDADLWFSILSGSFVAVTVPGVVGNLTLMFLLPKAHLLHKNVRYLMVNMTVAALAICLWCGGRGIYNLLLIFQILTISKPISPATCALIEIVPTTSAFLLILSVFGMGAERLYATWKRETSDKRSDWLSIMIIGLWITAVSNTFVQVITSDRSPILCYCHSITAFHRTVLFLTCAGYFCMEIPALIMYFVVRRWNRNRLMSFGVNAATHSLSERFQIWNNLRATEMLLASVLTHGLCWSVVQIGSYPAYMYYYDHSNLYQVNARSLSVLHVVMFFMIFHAAIHPYISVWCSEHLRKTLRRHIDALKGVKTAPATNAAIGNRKSIMNANTNGFFEPALGMDERPQFATRAVPAKVAQRMGVQKKPTSRPGPSYQVYQITPEQSAALLQRFWR